jgi:lipoate-protein ligase A
MSRKGKKMSETTTINDNYEQQTEQIKTDDIIETLVEEVKTTDTIEEIKATPATDAEIKKALAEADKAKALREKEKEDKFKDVGSKRLTNACNAISGMANLANTNNYSYSDKQVEFILTSLRSRVDNLESAFKAHEAKVKSQIIIPG